MAIVFGTVLVVAPFLLGVVVGWIARGYWELEQKKQEEQKH